MPTQKITRPPLHPNQRAIYDCPARFRPVAAGRRFGKTRGGTLECVEVAIAGKRAWWVAPSYPMSRVGWRLIKHLAGYVPRVEIRLGDRMVVMPGGGTVAVRSADDPASLRGEGLDHIVVDEAAHIKRFDEVWQQSLRPALSDRKGSATFITTPASYNEFYELWKRGEKGEGDWQSFQFPTSANPFIDPAEIEAARLDLPELTFRQEYLAEFVQLAGAMFRREWFEIIEEAPEDARYVRYWDLAASTKTTADYTVGGKVGLRDDRLVVADVVRGRLEWPDAIRTIGSTAKADGIAVTQGIEDVGVQKGMYQLLMREPELVGLKFVPVPVNRDKIVRCGPWLARAEQGKVALVRGNWNAAFLDEVCAFPETKHDDQVDAVSGAVQMLAIPKRESRIWFPE